MTGIPRAPGFDATLALRREGYLFISRRCERLGVDAFRTRITLWPVVCMRGRAAAEVFYGADRFTRVGAMPQATLKLLQDRGSVQLLDGPAHRRRKALFLSMMTPASITRLVSQLEAAWDRSQAGWAGRERVVLLEELRFILMHATSLWCGLDLSAGQLVRRTEEAVGMITGAGSRGPRNWRAFLLRNRSERWARRVIRQARSGSRPVPRDSPLDLVATHHDEEGHQLSVASAAVELLNLLRPAVAVAHYVVFAALALHRNPRYGEIIRSGDDRFLHALALEVRRDAPFFPTIGGRVKAPFDYLGHHFKVGDWVLLDLHGTNHDPKTWSEPDTFRPERFLEREPGAFDLVPQGGGDHPATHRCPGEWATEALLETAILRLARLPYRVPPQDLTVDLSTMPALPRSGFVLSLERAAGS